MEQTKSSKGWMITYLALGINLIMGVLYSWSVFKKALVADWGWDDAQAALPFSISAPVFAFTMIFAGRAQDKFGPRIVAMLGGLILGSGLILSGLTHSPLMMSITFGVIGGIGIGLGYSATTPCAIKWFESSKKGLISGIVVSGVGLSPVYMAPLTSYLIQSYGIQSTFMIEGVGAIIAVFLFSLLLNNPPAGYVPVQTPSASGAQPAAENNLDWSEMLKKKEFYFLWLMYLLTATAGLMLIGHMASIAGTQASWKAGFLLVVILSIFNAGGRIFGGILSDKVGRINAMLIVFIIQAINMFLFSMYTSIPVISIGAAVAGLAYGALFSLFPTATADSFGIKNLGVNYGLVFTGWGIAGYIGPMLGGIVKKTTGSYNLSYMIAGVLLVLGCLLIFLMKKPVKK